MIAYDLDVGAETLACTQGKQAIGIGFGLTADYGAAQRLYPKLGYIPEGKGVQPSLGGEILYMTKDLSGA